MHGTFPLPSPYGRSTDRSEIVTILPGLLFAVMPLIIATLVAVLRCGSTIRLSDILDVLSAAAQAAPL
jgi:hypothetical protein